MSFCGTVESGEGIVGGSVGPPKVLDNLRTFDDRAGAVLCCFGFDLFLETPLGLDALAYALVGYGVGIIEGGLLRSPRWLPSVLGVAGGLAGGLILIGIGVLAGVENVKGTHGVQTIAIAALYDGLLAPFVFFAVTRTVGRADDIRTSWSIR